MLKKNHIAFLFVFIPLITYSQKKLSADTFLISQIQEINKKIYSIEKKISNDSLTLHNLIVNFDELNNKNQLDTINKIVESISAEKENSSEYWTFWKDLVIQIVSAFLGFSGAYFLFKKATKTETQKEAETEKQKMEDKNHYLGLLIHSSLQFAIKQNEGIKTHYETIEKDPLYIPLIPIHIKQDLVRLSKIIDNPEYYHAFLDQYGSGIENVKKYKQIAYDVDFLITQLEQVFSIQEKALEFDRKRKEDYKTLFESISDLAKKLAISNDNTQLSNIIINIIKNYNAGFTNYFDLHYHQSNYIDPLRSELIPIHTSSKAAYEMMIQLDKAFLIYQEMMAQNKEHSNDFKSFYDSISKVIPNLETNSAELIEEFKNNTPTI